MKFILLVSKNEIKQVKFMLLNVNDSSKLSWREGNSIEICLDFEPQAKNQTHALCHH